MSPPHTSPENAFLVVGNPSWASVLTHTCDHGSSGFSPRLSCTGPSPEPSTLNDFCMAVEKVSQSHPGLPSAAQLSMLCLEGPMKKEHAVDGACSAEDLALREHDFAAAQAVLLFLASAGEIRSRNQESWIPEARS
jgi:hypothetical protein